MALIFALLSILYFHQLKCPKSHEYIFLKFKTSEKIARHLESLGIEVTRNVGVNGVVKEEKKGVQGVVIEALPDTLFKVLLEDDTEKLAFLSGKMKMNRIRVMVGDKVLMEIDPYGGKARIFKRM